MATYRIKAPDGSTLRFEGPDDATDDQVMSYAMSQWKPEAEPEPVGSRLNRELGAIPRQLGLTGRSAIEGPLEMAGIFSDPLAYGLSKLTGQPVMTGGEMGSYLADKLGLPTPDTGRERVVGHGSKLMTGIGGQAALASKAAPALSGAAQKVVESLARAPTSQLSSAVGGGTAGQYIKEEGGNPASQFVGALAGGFGGTAAPAVASKIVSGVSSLANAVRGTKASIDNISANLDRILNAHGVSVKDISQSTRNQILAELKKASDTGSTVDEAAIRRLADFDLVPGTTPTRGAITLDPVQITQEKNLVKAAANSQDPRLNQLARIPRENDEALTRNLNDLGARQANDALGAGERLQGALKRYDAPRKMEVDAAYQAVRDSAGRYADLDVPTFSTLANNALDENMLGTALPSQAKNLLNDISAGKIPLNVNTVVQLDKRLSGIASDAVSSGNREGALAIRKVRDALFNTPVKGEAGEKAIKLYEEARNLAAKRFQAIDENPAMKAALDKDAPDKFVETYITGNGGKAAAQHVAALARDLSQHVYVPKGNKLPVTAEMAAQFKKMPEAYQSARDQIALYLKNKALSGNADEVGNFSQAAYNKALNQIGDRKLSMFFKPDEIRQLKAIGRVASYTKFQPTGSAVNNSNTASAAAGLMERAANNNLVGRIPFAGPAISEPLKNWANQINARTALNPMGGLLQPQQQSLLKLQPGMSIMLPALLGTE